MSTIKVVGRGLRGLSFADVARRTGAYGALVSDSDLTVMQRFAAAVAAGGGVVGDVGGGIPATSALPTGGATGQVLAKLSGADGDVGWIDLPTAGSGGGAGSGPTYGAHAYWRLKITANGGGPYLAIGELDFYAAGGVTNLAAGGTPIASSAYTSDYTADRAFDFLLGSCWSPEATTGWIGYHFASPVTVATVLVTLGAGRPVDHAPRDMVLEYSDDAALWTAAFPIGPVTSWTVGTSLEFTYPGAS